MNNQVDKALTFMESMYGPGISGSMKDSALESGERAIRALLAEVSELRQQIPCKRLLLQETPWRDSFPYEPCLGCDCGRAPVSGKRGDDDED